MARVDVEKTLLFGMLGVQTGLIDQVTLACALREWARTKDRALTEILVEKGDLNPDGKALIEAVAEKHVELHGNIIEKSLAVVLQAGYSTRASLAQIGDLDLEATLSRVGSESTLGPESEHVAGAAAGTAPSEGKRFRVLRPHARGGLGAVFVALDAELNREVALKQILDRHADDPDSRSRFVLEAEITGGLEHPGIVPVYGLGSYGDGRPYYAMRFVRGDSLKEAIERFHAGAGGQPDAGSAIRMGAALSTIHSKGPPTSRELDLRKLLRRFLDICNAIDYAHSRGVLHRDIKPSNIIVGKHGETLVIDWGLAKATGKGDTTAGEQTLTPRSPSGSAETLPGSAMGTPAFMSPEQARGETEQLGPRSDVYSLGATLYCVLTGKAPVESDDIQVVLKAVQQGEFPPPRRRDPSIDKTLESVCKKAMALQPEDRYPTARALADDIERWMADEPVTAMPDTWARRLARWTRRHRSATRAGAASLLIIATVATLAALAIGQEHARTRRALLAETQARLAESRARGLAQEQSLLALDAIREYDTGVSREFLLRQPEMEGLRKSLLQAPLRFYRRLAQNIEDNGLSDPGARARLGQVQLDLGKLMSEVGSVEASIVSLEQARDNIEQAVRDDPTSPERRFLLARARCFLGNRYDKASRPDDARRLFDQALPDCERLVRQNPRENRFAALQAELLQHRADFLWDHGDLDGSRRDYIASVAIGARLVHDQPDDLEILDKHGSALNNLSLLYGEIGKREDQDRTLIESTTLRERLVASVPTDHPLRDEYVSNLGSCYQNLGSAQLDKGHFKEAGTWFRRALAIQEDQVKNRPNIAEFLERVGATLTQLGDLDARQGQFATARSELERSLEFLARLVNMRPRDVVYRSQFAGSLGLMADIEDHSGSAVKALTLERQVVSEAEEMIRINSLYHPAPDLLAVHLRRAADLSWELGDSDRPLSDLARSEVILRRLAASYPDLANYRRHLANTIASRVRKEREIGQERGTEARLREALAIADEVLRNDPVRESNLVLVGELSAELAGLLGEQAKTAEAEALFTRAFDSLDQARARSPEDAGIRRTLVQGLAAQAKFLRRIGRLGESKNAWDRALGLAAGDETLALRLDRAMTVSRSGDYRTALIDAAAAERATPERASLLLSAAACHAGVSEAINRDPALSQSARTAGAAAQRDTALDLIRQTRETPAYRDARRLLTKLLAPEFAPLRADPRFQILMMDLTFPATPFALPD